MLDAAVPNAQTSRTRTAWVLAVLLVMCSAVALLAAPARAGPSPARPRTTDVPGPTVDERYA
jgi:hypothetical protein